MRKITLLFILLFSTQLFLSQTYQWQWAKQGGGNSGNSVYTSTSSDENIKSIATDSDGNYYFLTWIYNNLPVVDTTPISTYSNRDLLIYSTDCSGNLRWTKVIGGYGNSEFAMKIEVDNSGGLYLMASLSTAVSADSPAGYNPTHLDTNVTLPVITSPSAPPYPFGNAVDPAFKTLYFLKYNTSNGNLIWYKALQGDVTLPVGRGDNGLWCMDSNKNIHAVLGFYKGTHLNGNITVPNSYDYDFALGNNNVGPQYYLVKFNYDNGSMSIAPNPLLLPVTGSFGGTALDGQAKLLYDEALNRYYIAGKRMYSVGTFEYSNLSYGGVPFNNEGYIFTFDGNTGNEIWRKEFAFPYLGQNQKLFDKIFDIQKDSNSNIYICGHYSKYSANNGNGWPTTSTFGGGTLPATNLINVIPFVFKINPSGSIAWMTVPSENSLNGTHMDNSLSVNFIGGLAINGDELAFTKGAIRETWGNFPLLKPLNARSDPLLVRLNLQTGAVIATHEIVGNYGTEDQITAVTVDRDGNYVVGGFFAGQLFTNPNDGVPTVTSSSTSGYSQFFIAKLGKNSNCTLNTSEVDADEAGLQFYPNPVQDFLTIKSKNKLESYEVYSSVGQSVLRGSLGNTNAQINMSALTAGVYYVKVKTEKAVVTEKVVKK